jgi:hypothetical protein
MARTNPQAFQVASGWENLLLWRQLTEYTHDYFRRFPLRGDSGPSVPHTWSYPSAHALDARVCRRQMLRMAHAVCEHLDFLPLASRLRYNLAVQRTNLKRLESITRLDADDCGLHCQFRTNNTRHLLRSLPSRDQREFFLIPLRLTGRRTFARSSFPECGDTSWRRPDLSRSSFCSQRCSFGAVNLRLMRQKICNA